MNHIFIIIGPGLSARQARQGRLTRPGGGQSAARRWATLSVVLADEKRKLVGNGDADLARIRQEVFGDAPASKPDEKKPEPALDLPGKQLNELADVLKKFRDLFAAGGK